MLKKILMLLVWLFLCQSPFAATDGIVGNITASSDYTFTNKWYKTKGESIPFLTAAKNVFKNQKFILYPIVGGYTLDSNSIARVKYDLKIFRPDSSVYYESYNVTALDTKITNPSFIMLADELLEVNFEDEDPLGTYQIEVTLKDFNSQNAGTISIVVNLVEFKRVGGFTTDSVLNEWMQNYYKSLNPEAALEACLYVAAKVDKETFFDLSLSFFKELFDHNQFLIPYLEDEVFVQSDEAADYIGTLLALLNYDHSRFKMRLSLDQVALFEEVEGMKNLFEITMVNNPTQLDMLWAQFFAGGSNEPIAKIVSALSLKEYDIPHQDSLKNLSPDEKLLYATYKAAVWSLEANAANHELVYNYLNYMLAYEKLPETIKSELKIILHQ